MMSLVTTIIVYTCSAYSVVLHAIKPVEPTSMSIAVEEDTDEETDPLRAVAVASTTELSPLLIAMDSATQVVLSENTLAAEYTDDSN